MTPRRLSIVLTLLALPVLLAGCSKRDVDGLETARAPVDPVVFADDLVGLGGNDRGDVYYQPFSGTYAEAVSVDDQTARTGDYSLKAVVPGDGSPLGAYTGGVLTAVGTRDITDFNALTFYAKSSAPTMLNEAGYGNDNTGTSLYTGGRSNIPLGTDWTFVVIPIPNPSRLIAERGLFMLAEGWEDGLPEGHTIWFDDIRFASLENITDPFPVMPSSLKQYFIGSTVGLQGTYTRYSVDGGYVVTQHMPGYFDFDTTDQTVAVVEDNEIRVVGEGTAAVTATLNGEPVNGTVVLYGFLPPTAPAPAPAHPSGDVISLFSDVYDDEIIDEWNPNWGAPTEMADYDVQGDATKMFTGLTFAGISFYDHRLDVTAMTHLSLDVFAPAGADFKVKIVAFAADTGSSAVEIELVFDDTTTPAFAPAAWSTLDIPLADFGFTTTLEHVGQLVISTTDARLVLVDNLYFHR